MTEDRTEIVPCAALRLGDRITEIDTPQGPFYDVIRETAKSVWYQSEDGARYDVSTRVGKSPRSGVRRLVAP